MIISICIGIPLGLVAALHQNSAIDYATTTFAVIMNAMPGFLVAVILMLVFALKLGWFPPSGADSWKSFVLPIIAAGIGPITQDARMTRSSVLEVIRQDYVRTARAKGQKEGVIVTRHMLRNAMIPIVTTVGLQFGFSLGGAVLVETVFSWPGIGRLLVDCIGLKDTPVVVACVLVLATMFTIINLCIDILYAFLDPRIRAQYKTAKR